MDALSGLLTNPPFITFLLPPFAVLALFIWRSGSIYALLERAWRLTAGSEEVADPILRDFIQKNRSVEKFRFMYGFKVDSIRDAHRLVAWLEAHSIDTGLALKARRWIDPKIDVVSLRQPSKGYVRLHMGIALLCVLLGELATLPPAAGFALAKMKASGTWFIADEKSVRGWVGQWALDRKHCEAASSVAMLSGFSEDETLKVCAALESEAFAEFARETAKRQRKWWRSASALLFIAAFLSVRSLDSAGAAQDIRKRLSAAKEAVPGQCS